MRNPTTTKNAPGEGNTQRIREKCTQCIHPALTRDSPGLQGRFLQPRSKAWENNPAAAGDHGAAASRLRHYNPGFRRNPVNLRPRASADRPDIE